MKKEVKNWSKNLHPQNWLKRWGVGWGVKMVLKNHKTGKGRSAIFAKLKVIVCFRRERKVA